MSSKQLFWVAAAVAMLATMPFEMAQAAPQYNFSCSSCHGMPPLDGATRNSSTGALPGNHQTHQPPAAAAVDCAKCHVSAGFTTGHLDGRVSFSANLNNSPAISQYKIAGAAVTFKNQTSVPVLGNCSNANCHFEATTPVWGSANLSSAADCSVCHAAPGTSSPHAKHDQYYAGVSNCAKCHPDWATGLKFSHATSAANRGIKITLSEGAYSGSGLNFLPSQSASRTLGTCSTLYCHSDGTKNSGAYTVRTIPSWSAAPGALGCAGCHGGTGTLATGSHVKHLSSAVITDLTCVRCHSATVNSAGAISSTADHVDHNVTIRFASSTTAVNGTYNGQAASTAAAKKTPGTAFGSCANVYCHSDGTKASGFAGKSVTPTWGGTAMDCTSCHGGGLGSAAFKSLSTGRHAKHVLGAYQYNYACSTCHSATTNSDGSINDKTKHVNSQIDVVFSGTATTGGASAIYTINGHAPGQAGTVNDSCQNVYCHSNAQVGGQAGTQLRFRNLTGSKRFNQTTTVSLGCSGCHTTGSTTSGQWTLSGKHLAHVSATANPAIGKALACDACHLSGGTNFNRANHANGFINYSGPFAGRQSSLNVATGECSNVYCHSNGKGTFKSLATNNWFTINTLDCKGCHGSESAPAFTSQFGEPNYAASNSHQKHVGAATDCYACHRTATTSTGTLSSTTTHANGSIDVRLSVKFNNLSGVYNSTTKTCSATACHSNGAPVWGNAATGACGTCHDVNATIAGAGKPTISTNGHDSHLTLTYGPASYLGSTVSSCQTCHTSYVAGAGHVNGTAPYASGAGSACFNCHAGSVPAWNVAAHSLSCEGCHGSTPAQLPNGVAAPSRSTNFLSSGHGKYAVSNTCISCHDQNSAHISGTLGDATRLLSALGTGNTNCSYCHNDPVKVPTARFQNMSTHFLSYGGTQAMGCNMCHDPHGSGNLSMIKAKIKFNNLSATITYNDRTAGWINLANSRGLCQVCHTATKYYKSGVAETEHYTTNCFSCHAHNAKGGAFRPTGNCDSCHGYPPVPRQTLTAFTFGRQGNYSSAKFEDYSGGGGAHVVDAHVSKTVMPGDGWTPCLNCHSGGASSHVRATPIRSNVANVTVSVKQGYRKYNVAEFITYSGAKLNNPPANNVTGTCYNTSCHFKPSPKWSTER